jgi:hypothetical protein
MGFILQAKDNKTTDKCATSVPRVDPAFSDGYSPRWWLNGLPGWPLQKQFLMTLVGRSRGIRVVLLLSLRMRISAPLTPLLLVFCLVIGLIGQIVGCGSDNEQHLTDDEKRMKDLLSKPSEQVGAGLGIFRMRYPQKTESDLVSWIHTTAERLTQQTLTFNKEWTVESRRDSPFMEREDLIVDYNATYNELKITNISLIEKPAGTDIGFEAARKEMNAFFNDLVAEELIDERHFDPSSAEVGSIKTGLGPIGGEHTEQVVAYQFSMLRLVNGIPTVNAGVRLGIHSSGQRSSIKLGGVELESKMAKEVEIPINGGEVAIRQVSTDDIENRFEALITQKHGEGYRAIVLAKGLRYQLPDDVFQGLVEPKHCIDYTIQPSDVAGRWSIVFSVIDPSAAPQE